MPNDLSVWTMVLDASPIVQAVVFLLLIASLVSWAIIFQKSRVISKTRTQAERFEGSFWSGGDLATLYRNIEIKGREGTGLQSVFEAGFGEFSRLRQMGVESDQLLTGARRAMKVAQLRELERMESNLATLATIGSTSPYVGLFGTVWGIMSAFHNLGNVQQATLAAVAPGIAEALITTAIGLFAAIPAVIFYNRLADQVSRLGTSLRYLRRRVYDDFATSRARAPAAGVAMAAAPTRRRRLMAEINVVPYIDVMLVLLIIFMVTAPLLKEGVKVDSARCQRQAHRCRIPEESRAAHSDHRCARSPVPELRPEPGSTGSRGHHRIPDRGVVAA